MVKRNSTSFLFFFDVTGLTFFVISVMSILTISGHLTLFLFSIKVVYNYSFNSFTLNGTCTYKILYIVTKHI
ncbi:hypothetical protein BD770DRAFT_380613 [Pilaira anomala]|nr:hypothetical protein BD770DRAFT_380613 [Pilaira anomala]